MIKIDGSFAPDCLRATKHQIFLNVFPRTAYLGENVPFSTQTGSDFKPRI